MFCCHQTVMPNTTITSFFDLCQHLFRINNDFLTEEVPKLWPEDSWVRTMAYVVYYIIVSVFGYILVRIIGECFFVWSRSRNLQKEHKKVPKHAHKHTKRRQKNKSYSSTDEESEEESSSD